MKIQYIAKVDFFLQIHLVVNSISNESENGIFYLYLLPQAHQRDNYHNLLIKFMYRVSQYVTTNLKDLVEHMKCGRW